MAQFNLINTGSIQTNTTSGTGNVSLSSEEIRALYDGNTTSSGVTVSGTDVLYLDIDVGFRVRLDELNLYIDVPGDRATALTNVDFYYKYNEADTYTICAKNYDSEKFYATGTPALFTPRYVRIVVDNQEADIYEVELLNDDTQVSFGEDGNQTLVILNQTIDGYDELGVFNNNSIGSESVNAYVMVDYQGLDSDYYITLSDDKDGPYYGLEDGVDLKNSDLSKTYNWEMGTMNNTEVFSEGGIATVNQNVGYYKTPLFDMSDKFQNTFVMTEVTTVSGSLITWDDTFNTETMKIRSSDEYPLPFNKFVWFYREPVTNRCYMTIGDMTNFTLNDQYYSVWTSSGHLPDQMLFDRKRGKVYLIYYNTSNSAYRIRRYDYATKTYEAQTSSESTLNNVSTHDWSIDSEGRIWGYVKQSGFRLVHFSYDLGTRTTVIEDDASDFVGGLSASKGTPTCWYTNTKQNKIEHVDYEGNSIVSIGAAGPTKVTALPDGGCWAVHADDSKLVQYSYYGTVQRTINYDSSTTITKVKFGAHSTKNPFRNQVLWLWLSDDRILQIDFEANVISENYISDVSNIEPFSGGCLVHCSNVAKTYQLNDDGEVSYIWDWSSYSNRAGRPYPMVVYYEEFLTLSDKTNFLPLVDDPYWGEESGWEEIPISGEKLSMHRYHQLMFKFTPKHIPVPLTNPGAEMQNFTGWNRGGNSSLMVITSAYAYSGTYSFGDGAHDSYIYQHIYLSSLPEIDYNQIDREEYMVRATCMTRVTNTSELENADLRLYFYNELGNSMKDVRVQVSESSGWRFNDLITYIPSGTRAIRIQAFNNDTGQSTISIYWDDFTLDIFRSSRLDKILIPKPVIIKDIKPQEFKKIYIKTDIPAEAEYKEYETRLKCWWGNEEE